MENWSKTPPNEQAWYWHWNGDEDSRPFVFSILKSGTNNECFIAAGQGGFMGAVWCKDHGGWWKKLAEPVVPLETLDKPCPICEKEECLPREDWCANCCDDFYEKVQG